MANAVQLDAARIGLYLPVLDDPRGRVARAVRCMTAVHPALGRQGQCWVGRPQSWRVRWPDRAGLRRRAAEWASRSVTRAWKPTRWVIVSPAGGGGSGRPGRPGGQPDSSTMAHNNCPRLRKQLHARLQTSHSASLTILDGRQRSPHDSPHPGYRVLIPTHSTASPTHRRSALTRGDGHSRSLVLTTFGQSARRRFDSYRGR